MGPGSRASSDEWGKPNLFSEAHQRESLPLSLNDKSKTLLKWKGKCRASSAIQVHNMHLAATIWHTPL